MTPTIPKVIELEFARLELFDDYVITTIYEGTVVGLDHLQEFYKIFDRFYSHRPFGYISNRIYDYTVDPTCYMQEYQYPQLVGIAVWCHSAATYKNARFEKTFYRRPFDGFYELEDCKNWVLNGIADYKEKAGL